MELLPVAHRILGALEDRAENVASRLQQQSGVVRVSASPAALGGCKLDRFATRYPDIQVHISQVSDTDPLKQIVDRSVDVVCTREPAVVPAGWRFHKCLDDGLIAVCGRSHPLAKRSKISNADLAEAKWLLNRVGSVARARFEEIAQIHGWPRESRCQMIMHIPELTKEMLATGKYLAILPRGVAMPWLDVGDVIEMETEISAPLRPLGLLWEQDKAGSATAALVSHLKAT